MFIYGVPTKALLQVSIILFPVSSELHLSSSYSAGHLKNYDMLWQGRLLTQPTFPTRFCVGAPSNRGKWTDWNANFHTMINLQYETVGIERSPSGCALLLYSISQLLPAITVNPANLPSPARTKPLLHYIYQAMYKRWKHMTAALRAVFPPGLRGLCWGRGPPAGLWSICSLKLGRQWHHEGHFHSSPSSRSSSYRLVVSADVFSCAGSSRHGYRLGFRVKCERSCQICFCWHLCDEANHLTKHLIATSLPRCSPLFSRSYSAFWCSPRLFMSLSVE